MGRISWAAPSSGLSAMTDFSEETIARLLAALPPAPEGWTRAAVELPQASAAIEELTASAMADQEARAMMLADLEAALRQVGVEPRRQLLESLRARLNGLP